MVCHLIDQGCNHCTTSSVRNGIDTPYFYSQGFLSVFGELGLLRDLAACISLQRP